MPKNIVTFDSAEQIKKAEERRNDEQILMKMRDRDLIASKFRKHEKCYRDYTQIYKNEPSEEQVYDKGNYEGVRSELLRKSISIKTIIEAYGIGKDQHQYRSMLKHRFIKTFGNKILFVTPENNSQQVNLVRIVYMNKPYLNCLNSV